MALFVAEIDDGPTDLPSYRENTFDLYEVDYFSDVRIGESASEKYGIVPKESGMVLKAPEWFLLNVMLNRGEANISNADYELLGTMYAETDEVITPKNVIFNLGREALERSLLSSACNTLGKDMLDPKVIHGLLYSRTLPQCKTMAIEYRNTASEPEFLKQWIGLGMRRVKHEFLDNMGKIFPEEDSSMLNIYDETSDYFTEILSQSFSSKDFPGVNYPFNGGETIAISPTLISHIEFGELDISNNQWSRAASLTLPIHPDLIISSAYSDSGGVAVDYQLGKNMTQEPTIVQNVQEFMKQMVLSSLMSHHHYMQRRGDRVNANGGKSTNPNIETIFFDIRSGRFYSGYKDFEQKSLSLERLTRRSAVRCETIGIERDVHREQVWDIDPFEFEILVDQMLPLMLFAVRNKKNIRQILNSL